MALALRCVFCENRKKKTIGLYRVVRHTKRSFSITIYYYIRFSFFIPRCTGVINGVQYINFGQHSPCFSCIAGIIFFRYFCFTTLTVPRSNWSKASDLDIVFEYTVARKRVYISVISMSYMISTRKRV